MPISSKEEEPKCKAGTIGCLGTMLAKDSDGFAFCMSCMVVVSHVVENGSLKEVSKTTIHEVLAQEREEFEKKFPHIGKTVGNEIYGCRQEVRSHIDLWQKKLLEAVREDFELQIGFLRQWLNEERITNPKKMVTNEEIKSFLASLCPKEAESFPETIEVPSTGGSGEPGIMFVKSHPKEK